MAKQRIRTQGMLIFLGVLLVIALSNFLIPHGRSALMDTMLDIAGFSMVLTGFMFRFCARGYKQEHSSQSQELVTTGPYACVRNPMYFGTLLIGSGIVVMLFALWALPVFLLVYLLIYVPEINREEIKLREHFGQSYIDYCAATPGYFPRLSYILKAEKLFSLKFAWVKKELPSLIGVIAVLFSVELAEDVMFFGWPNFRYELLKLTVILLVFLWAGLNLIHKSKA